MDLSSNPPETTLTGWLLDLYDNQRDGVNLWVIAEDDGRVCLDQPLTVTFSMAGPTKDLHNIWVKLRKDPAVLSLQRVQKHDVFRPELVDALQVTVDTPSRQQALFHALYKRHPELTYYDADIPINTRHAALFGTFPMAKCRFHLRADGKVAAIEVLNSRWDLRPELPPYRILHLQPDVNPTRETPQWLSLQCDRFEETIALSDPTFLSRINTRLLHYDPDFIVAAWGDSWLMPLLLSRAKAEGATLALNRDPLREVHWQKELSYFSYGQIIHRPSEAHCFGRCHIDRNSAMMWTDYSLAGTLEMSRVSALPIEKAARVSPGQGISSMQVITALENGVGVPYQKQQVEAYKSGIDLIQADRGGIVYQPVVGLHKDVAQLDFVSMYPAVIITANISPEIPPPNLLTPSRIEKGIVPQTLAPLYNKRVELKKLSKKYPPNDPVTKNLKERSSALKWLLVVCFGFLGYKNARFGRIEAHEAVTRGGREVLLQAKEVAESMGFEVLHMYVDALWVKKAGFSQPKDFQPLMRAINQRTGLSIDCDGVHRWIAFLPSKTDGRIPVANRYFGIFKTGETKIRGLECRRRDTPPWVASVQANMIDRISKAQTEKELALAVTDALKMYKSALTNLKDGRVDISGLVINGKVSYELDQYKSPTPSVRAAKQLVKAGRSVRTGQRIRFVYTRGEQDVQAWDITSGAQVDKQKYVELLYRAGASVLEPFGVDPAELKEWSHFGAVQMRL